MSAALQSIVAERLRDLDPDVAYVDGDPIEWLATLDFSYRDVEGDVDLYVSLADNEVTYELATQVHDLQEGVLDDLLPGAPECDWSLDVDEEAEVVQLVLTTVRRPHEGGDDPGRCSTDLIETLVGLVELGAVSLTNVSALDETFLADVERLVPMKASNPKTAVTLALELSERARALGDHSMAAEIDLAAAEVLTDLGQSFQAVQLAEPAWKLLREPIERRDAASTYSSCLARAGRLTEASAVLDRALDVAVDDEDRQILLGNKGALLGTAGRTADLIDWTVASLSDPLMADEHRRTLEDNLFKVRMVDPAASDPADRRDDLLENVDRHFDRLRCVLQDGGTFADPTVLAELAALRLLWERLGPVQRVLLLLTEAQAVAGHDRTSAEGHWRDASVIADTSGDHLARTSVATVGAAFGWVAATADVLDDDEIDSYSQVYVRFNRTLVELTADDGAPTRLCAVKALDELLPIIDIAEAERFRLRDPRDRRRWTGVMSRTYGLAATLAHGLGMHGLVGDLIERFGAQAPRRSSSTSGSDDEGLGVSRHDAVAQLLEAMPGDVPVRPPERTPRINELRRAIGGPSAWWWSVRNIHDQLHWFVASPAGVEWSGASNDGDIEDLDSLVEDFDQDRASGFPHTSRELLDDAFGRMGRLLLPDCLRQAALDAAQSGTPIRLVVSAGSGLNQLPLPLASISADLCLLDGACVTLAPPATVAIDDTWRRPSSVPRAPIVALGANPRLNELVELVGSNGLALPPASVMGTQAHVGAGLAGSIATPDAVLERWSRDFGTVSVFYGHMDPPLPEAPLAGGLELAGERWGTARLSTERLVTTEPNGFAHSVVLAGCSSLGGDGAGTGEWWGVACEMLRLGTSYVVGSQWNLTHGRSTMAFVAEVVNELRMRTDAPAALREVQRRWHRKWRASGGEGFDPATRSVHPHIWAAFSVVGAADDGTSRSE